jgi:hypothetical protein
MPETRLGSRAQTVHVAETASLALLGMVKASGPVDSSVALVTIETGGTLHATTSADSTEIEEAVEDRAVIANVEFALLLLVGIHIVRRDLLEEVDVLVGMELGHLALGSRFGTLSHPPGQRCKDQASSRVSEAQRLT